MRPTITSGSTRNTIARISSGSVSGWARAIVDRNRRTASSPSGQFQGIR